METRGRRAGALRTRGCGQGPRGLARELARTRFTGARMLEVRALPAPGLTEYIPGRIEIDGSCLEQALELRQRPRPPEAFVLLAGRAYWFRVVPLLPLEEPGGNEVSGTLDGHSWTERQTIHEGAEKVRSGIEPNCGNSSVVERTIAALPRRLPGAVLAVVRSFAPRRCRVAPRSHPLRPAAPGAEALAAPASGPGPSRLARAVEAPGPDVAGSVPSTSRESQAGHLTNSRKSSGVFPDHRGARAVPGG